MKKSLPFLLLLLVVHISCFAQVSINEVLTANYNGIVDEDTENSDWIELYNSGINPINLEGYALSDKRDSLAKWKFPAFNLNAKSYLIVFASEKNRTEAPVSYQTIITRGDVWKYLIPTSNIGTLWRSLSFDDSGWQEGQSGFGYGDNDDNTVLSPFQTIFIRKKFEISDNSKVKKLYLHIDYDDGFVAYINGVEIARADIDYTGTDVPYNALGIEHEARIYRGYAPNVYEITNPETVLVPGTNVIAIQGHNMSATSSDFSLIPFLTVGTVETNSNNTVHQYFTTSSNFFHTNFKISKTGETVYLSSPTGQITDSLAVPQLYNDISYGRQPDANKNCYFFGTPTPGATNNTQVAATAQIKDSVIFSSKGGMTSAGTMLTLKTPTVTDNIYFTTDGSVPTTNSTLYTVPLVISKDTVISARIFRNGALPGPVGIHTYVVNRTHKFPITCLSTDPENLWNINTGIYTTGLNASETMPYYGANYWQDWERPAQFEVFDTNGTNVVNQGVGIKIHGAYSRTHDQKSMAVFAREKYGKGSINHAFFDDKQISKFESIILRNAGQDGRYCMFRDGFITGMARNMDIDRCGFKPSAHYMNGKYWGILNVREKINEHFLADNQKFDTEDISMLESNAHTIMGDDEDYEMLLSFVNNNELNTSASYNEILNRMEVDNYIQYQLMQIYINNGDWPGNNIKYWRINTPDSKWRWILFDTDYSFSLYYTVNYDMNTLAYAIDNTQTEWPNPAWSTLLFRRLLTSTAFRNNFINQYCDHLNTTFLPSRVVAQIDSMQTLFDGEIQYHWEKWPQSNYNSWLTQVEKLRKFANNRPDYAFTHMYTTFGLESPIQVQVSVNDPAQGQVKLNSVVLNQASFTGKYFQNIPITLKALPKPGYKFERWEGSISATTAEISYNMASPGVFTAVFTKASDSDVNLVINEINYKSATDFDTNDWIELYNNGVATVDLGGWELTDLGKEASYYFPAGTILYPGDYIVACEKIKNFRNFRPSTRNLRGNFAFGLSSNGDKVRLYNPNKALIDAVDFGVAKPWPVFDNLTGGTLELVNPNLDNTKGESWAVNLNHGTPGKINAGTVATIDEKAKPVQSFKLSCFPNPFKDFTTIEINITSTNNYNIEIVDAYGRTVRHLINKTLTPDTYYLDWDGTDHNSKDLPKGFYFIRCFSRAQNQTIKVIKR